MRLRDVAIYNSDWLCWKSHGETPLLLVLVTEVAVVEVVRSRRRGRRTTSGGSRSRSSSSTSTSSSRSSSSSFFSVSPAFIISYSYAGWFEISNVVSIY